MQVTKNELLAILDMGSAIELAEGKIGTPIDVHSVSGSIVTLRAVIGGVLSEAKYDLSRNDLVIDLADELAGSFVEVG